MAKSNGRTGSQSKTTSSSDSSSGANDLATLNSAVNRAFAAAGSEIQDTAAARESAQLARSGILHQSVTSMQAQANLSPETVLSLLQE